MGIWREVDGNSPKDRYAFLPYLQCSQYAGEKSIVNALNNQ